MTVSYSCILGLDQKAEVEDAVFAVDWMHIPLDFSPCTIQQAEV